MGLKTEFLERCKEIQVPKPVFPAAWHQVNKQQLTMIVARKNGDIFMWFRDLDRFVHWPAFK